MPNKYLPMCLGGLSLAVLSTAAIGANVVQLTDADVNLLNQFSVAAETVHVAATNNANTLKVLSSNVDNGGIQHIRYQQYYNQIPVYGHQVITHGPRVASAGVTSNQLRLTGALVNDIAADVGAVDAKAFDANTMLAKLKQEQIQKNISGSELVFDNEEAELVYFLDANDKAHLAYFVSFFSDVKEGGMPSRPHYLIDAKTHDVLDNWDGLAYEAKGLGPGGNEKIGRYEYGTDYDALDVEVKSNNCFLSNTKVKTIDLGGGYSDWGKDAFKFPCFTQDSDAVNGAYSPLNDAHFFGGVVFDMFDDWYQTAPLKFQLKLRVHYGKSYENAFWDGRAMSFGDGRSRFHPLVALDVIAHEVSHGFTQQHSNLRYSGKSGGMNEAFSDMAGKAAEFYMRGENTWGIGVDITKGKAPLRYMDTPAKDGRSIGHVKNYYNGLDVHYSSGVYNKAFYHLSTTEGWNTRKAFDVMVAANSNYWQSNSDFANGAWGVVQAALDLKLDRKAVDAAFREVGVECGATSCVEVK